MSRQAVVTVLYRESGSGCEETSVRSGVPPDDAGYNAFEFRLVGSHSFGTKSRRHTTPPLIQSGSVVLLGGLHSRALLNRDPR